MVKLLHSFLRGGVALLSVMVFATACAPQTGISLPGKKSELSQRQQESDWAEVGELPLPLESHQMVKLGDFVYVLGGWNDKKGPYAEVYFTRLTSEGSLGDWQEATAAMPLRLQHHAVIVHNEALYVLGGDNGFFEKSKVSDRIFRAVPNAQGDITDWVEVGQLPEPLTIHGVTTIDDQVYVIGGSQTFRPGSTVSDGVFTAKISAEGEFGEFEKLASFPNPIGWLTATAIDGRIFAISGKEQFSPTRLIEKVWVAEAEADGQLSPFEPISTVVPRERHTTVLLDRTLVVIAGGGAKRVLSSVEAGEVDGDGNIANWTELSPLPEPRYAHAVFAHDGDIYVSGGFVRYGSNETSRKVFRLSSN